IGTRTRDHVKVAGRPWYSARPSVMRPRIARAYSESSASDTALAPMVYAALSPDPMPIRVRPGASSARVAAAEAATAGCRVTGVMTREPSRTRAVTVAQWASVTYTSRLIDCESEIPSRL